MAIYPTDAVEDNTKTLRLHNQIYGQYMVHPNPGLPGYLTDHSDYKIYSTVWYQQ